MEENNNKNLILATVLSFLVITVWFVLFPPPEAPAPDLTQTPAEATGTGPAAAPPAGTAAATPAEVAPVPEAARLTIDTPELSGSISMRGGRFDDLLLKSYRDTLDPDSPDVRLFTPVGEGQAYYALFGWAPAGSLTAEDVPGPNTEWQIAKGATLRPGEPVTLAWENTKGQRFTREIAVDDKFMFTVTDTVQNSGAGDITLRPYGLIARHGTPSNLQNIFVVHEGVVGRADGELTEIKYKDIVKLDPIEGEGHNGEKSEATADGWVGFTDHYWMSVLVPEQGQAFTEVIKHVPNADIFQTEIRHPTVTVAAGQTSATTTRLFAGAKEWETIRDYQAGSDGKAAIPGFIDSIDWGWFYFLTKPIFSVLHWLHGLIGNMGLAIIALTFVLKVLVLPLAYKSYVSMARMKELQPEMEVIKERAGEDKQRLQREMMQLYKDRKVNPAAGCLPILIQIPIFFSLYKVIFVTLELRQAPFFGWLKDLSQPDPSSLYNLFGLLPWDAPAAGTILHLVFIGALPILLGITMWLQQKLNPAPTDPVQASIFAWMPWVFMFMLGGFASGLVVYWITNNTITFTQQYLIMRSHGHKPDLFGNIKSGFKRKPATAAANTDKAPKGGAPKAGKK
ncbi:membrane protein insertase YidC [Xinfangfangia pollutisoli]|uniref:membrane protein insertase YidC n=1 Tax=Xinfangfangia pollutisoli TaxID=2865960 RepID=UPI001CD52738|nr:membrane protein insertase YidC [Xinfangfangia pollutisoli]